VTELLARLRRALWFLGRGTVVSVATNLSLAVLSVALAVVLWQFVTEQENPTETQTFNSAVQIRFVNVPNGLAVANASAATVRIRIEAPKNELSKLGVNDFEARVDLGGFERGQVTVPVEVVPPSSRVSVVDVSPVRIDVSLENERNKEVGVKVVLAGSPQQGFAATGTASIPERVTVTGPESLVDLVDSVAAVVYLTGLHVDVTEDRVELQPRDVRGGEISRVTVNPPTARVAVDLEQREYSLGFVVNPVISGEPAPGYNAAGVSVDPRLVTVTGPLDVLQSIDAVKGISTEEISIADGREDVTRQVRLNLPSGVRALGAETVRVTVSIRPAKGEASFQVVPQIRNVTDGLVATQAQPVTVTLSGDLPTLQQVTPESITVIADARGLEAGLHALPLQITPPAGTSVVRSDPGELGIALTPRP
jgi:YbbR domain-containing protein